MLGNDNHDGHVDDSGAEASASQEEPVVRRLGEGQSNISADLKKTLEETPVARNLRKRKELSRRREAKEISPFDIDLNFIFQLNEIGSPLTRQDLDHETGIQAVVLTREDMETLGCLDFIHASGKRMLIEPESLEEDDVLILYPEDLGDVVIFQLNEIGSPLTRQDLDHETGIQAVVLTRKDMEILGCLDFIDASGKRMLIEPGSLAEGDVLILYPEDLGDVAPPTQV